MVWGCIPAQPNSACRGSAVGPDDSTLFDDGCNGISIEAEPNSAAPYPCQYQVLPPTPDVVVDPESIQVVLTSSEGMRTKLPRVAVAADCSTSAEGGFYYVHNTDPHAIRLCPCSCAAMQSTDSLSIVWGCSGSIL